MPYAGQFAASNVPTAADLNTLLPFTLLYTTTGQTVTATTEAALTFTTEVVDRLAWHSTTTNTARITPTIAGLYRAIGGVRATNALGNGGRLTIRKNGTTVVAVEAGDLAATGANSAISVSTVINMNGTTDYLEVLLYNAAAASRTTDIKHFSVVLLRAT